jgi:hypothetical protein
MFKIPTGAIIRQEEHLKNKIMVEIPQTRFVIMGAKLNSLQWKVSVMDKISGASRTIGDKVEEHSFAVIISKALSTERQTWFKEIVTINTIKNIYKELIQPTRIENQFLP